MPRSRKSRLLHRSLPSAGVGLAMAAVSAVVPSAAAAAPAAAPTARAATPAHVAPRVSGTATRALLVAAKVPTTAPEMTYVVVAGDTVSGIARRTGTTTAAIIAANGLDASGLIRVGQVLRIPSPTATAAAPAAAPAPSGARTHRVVAGDTVSGLATRYGSTIAAIISANGLGPTALIRIGDVLTIPGGGAGATAAPAPAAPAPSGARTHRVVAGDTVSGLATRYGSTIAAIISANGLGPTALIRIGDVLTIPGGGAGATAAPAPLVGATFAGRTYAAPTVASANANKATLLGLAVPSRAEMQQIVRSTAVAMGVDPALAQAIAMQESGFDQRAVSPANAIGTMQVIPSSGVWASQLVGRQLNLLDPYDNATAGVAILRALVRTAPDLGTAIAGYYQGLGSVQRNGMYADTQRYVANILALMTRYS